MKDNTKITLTYKQLKQLIKESEYEKLEYSSDWFGVDAGLDISLFEYGFILKPEGDEYRAIAASDYEENKFYSSWVSESDINEMYEKNLKKIIRYTGDVTSDNWRSWPIANKIMDLKTVYSNEDIFGTSYYGYLDDEEVAKIIDLPVEDW